MTVEIPKRNGMLHYRKGDIPLTAVQSTWGSISEPYFRLCCSLCRVYLSTETTKRHSSHFEKLEWQNIRELIDIKFAIFSLPPFLFFNFLFLFSLLYIAPIILL